MDLSFIIPIKIESLDRLRNCITILSYLRNVVPDADIYIKEVDEKKIEYTKQILKVLNTIISKYVEENSIQMVFSKKDIIIAKKDLDITDPVMELLNNKLTKIDF